MIVLDKPHWQSYFDKVSKMLAGKLVDIELKSEKLGDPLQASDQRLFGLSYDPKNDMFEVLCEGLEHMIRNPKSISVEEQGLELCRVELSEEDGTRQILLLHRPISLA